MLLFYNGGSRKEGCTATKNFLVQTNAIWGTPRANEAVEFMS